MRAFIGETVGTFILVFIGLATVVNAAIIEIYSGVFQVAALWGIGLTLAITLSGPMSGAHLNPAITLSFATYNRFPWSKVSVYIIAQCLGAFIAGCVLYLLYGTTISSYEATSGLVRGSSESIRSAMVFGEYFPNPAAENTSLTNIKLPQAFLAECLGTAILAFIIFTLLKLKGLPEWLLPILIGGTLTVLISLLAPLSMAGFNPARDLMPRICSSLFGWGSAPFTHNGHGWFTVYILAPVIGAQLGGLASHLLRTGDSTTSTQQ